MISGTVLSSVIVAVAVASMAGAVYARVQTMLSVIWIADADALLEQEPPRGSSEHEQWSHEARQFIHDKETYG